MHSRFTFYPRLAHIAAATGLYIVKLCRLVLYISVLSILMMNPGMAEEKRWYQAEVIIAERLVTSADKEQHPTTLAAPVKTSKKLKNYPSISSQIYTKLPASQHRLTSIKQRLQRSDEYQVLFHEAWPLAVAKEKPAVWIAINAGTEQHGHHQLEGAVGVSMGRFLHLHTQLHLNKFITKPTTSNKAISFISLPYQQAQVSRRYSMQQKRKMRSKELHYLDHPKLLLLVRFDPYTPQVGPLPKPEKTKHSSHNHTQQEASASSLSAAISVPLSND